jgi:hypothetical protein
VLGTPADLTKLIRIGKAGSEGRVRGLRRGQPILEELLAERIESFKRAALATRFAQLGR